MKKVIGTIKIISILLVGLTLLLILGSEPNTFTEESLESYYTMWDKGNSGWYLFWTFVWSIGVFILINVYEFFVLKKMMKEL